MSALISMLFSNSEQGAVYDPSDLSTMYQDSAGTTPVTAVGQPVGRILDKSGNGNHASQSTAASRPTLSARYNYFLATEASATWTKSNGGTGVLPVCTDNYGSVAAPDGTNTAIRVQLDRGASNTGSDYSLAAIPATTTPAAMGATKVWMRTTDGSTKSVFLRNGSAEVKSVTGTWQQFTYTQMPASAAFMQIGVGLGQATDQAADILVWHPDCRTSADASLNIPAYQRVTSSTDYDTSGFPYYLSFDGVDDSLATGSIDFSGTDKVTVGAMVYKASDAAVGMLVELSATTVSNNGTFHLAAPNGAAAANIGWRSKGTAASDVTGTGLTAPVSFVATGIGDISGDVSTLRVNGAQAATGATDQGTGNYGNQPLYIGRRGGSTLPFNGRLYGLVVRGAATDAALISRMERFLASRGGVSL